MTLQSEIGQAALLVASEGQTSKIRAALLKAADIDANTFDETLETLVRDGLVQLSKKTVVITEAGGKRLADVPEWVMALPATQRVRAWGSLTFLQPTERDQPQPQLNSANVVRACIVAKHLAPSRFRGIQATSAATIDAAMRAVVEVRLATALELQLPAPSKKFEGFKDPLLREIFLQIESDATPDIHVGFQRLLSAIYPSVTIPDHSPWKVLFAMGKGEEMLAATAVRLSGFLRKLEPSLSTAAAKAPSGWVPVSVAWDLFRADEPITLSDFKDRLLEEARNGSVELNPLSVSSLLATRVREQSEIVMGGRKFYYLRLAA